MTTRLTTATSSGGRWDGSRSTSGSRTRARQPATTEDETSRLSNVCHLNRDNDNGTQLDDDSPAAATAVSSAILRSSFSWLHSTANNDEDGYGKKWQCQSSPCRKSSTFGYNDVDGGPDKDIEEVDGGWGVPRWQRKRSNQRPATTWMMKMLSRGDWQKKYGSGSCRSPP